MAGVSTASQRDWRRHGYLPNQKGAHARFDIFAVAEANVMKMFAEQGKGPAVSSAYASRIALCMVKTALIWRRDVWGDTRPVDIFDALPVGSRSRSRTENYYHQQSVPQEYQSENSDEDKIEWVIDALLRAKGVREYVPHSTHAIWWPNGEVELADYNDESWMIHDDGPLDRVDPRFDGPASVLRLSACASNLARRSRLPFLSAKLEIGDLAKVNRPELHQDHGTIVVSTARKIE